HSHLTAMCHIQIEKRDLRVIALSAFGGFFLCLIALATRDLGAALIVGLAFGVPGGAGGGTVVCILLRYRERKENTKPVSTARIVRFVISFVVFGVLMGVRPVFESVWTRSLVAGIAGAVLGACLLPMGRRKA
ncbi:MAG: hypothetical protein NTW03_04800, partial [Verrucomicrobia bacterium]|nr:hypothetical protein [Verrucomicrobiota bacterium]